MKKATVVIAEDHPIFLEALERELVQAGMKVGAAASNGRAALSAIEQHQPDLAVLDISMPEMSGLQVAAKIRESQLPVKIILLSMHQEPGYFLRAKQLKVDGYLMKNSSSAKILHLIKRIIAGEVYYEEELVADYADQTLPLLQRLKKLTHSELKVLRQLSQGYSVQEIAELFMISPRTVGKHRENINRKLDLGLGQNFDLKKWAEENTILLTYFEL